MSIYRVDWVALLAASARFLLFFIFIHFLCFAFHPARPAFSLKWQKPTRCRDGRVGQKRRMRSIIVVSIKRRRRRLEPRVAGRRRNFPAFLVTSAAAIRFARFVTISRRGKSGPWYSMISLITCRLDLYYRCHPSSSVPPLLMGRYVAACKSCCT